MTNKVVSTLHNTFSNIEDITPDPITYKSSVNELAIKNNSTDNVDLIRNYYKNNELFNDLPKMKVYASLKPG